MLTLRTGRLIRRVALQSNPINNHHCLRRWIDCIGRKLSRQLSRVPGTATVITGHLRERYDGTRYSKGYDRKKIMAAFLIISVSGCTSLAGTTTSLKTNVACHTANVGTTAVSLTKGNVETNPLINAIKISSLGSVWGTVVPLAAVGVVAYYALKA